MISVVQVLFARIKVRKTIMLDSDCLRRSASQTARLKGVAGAYVKVRFVARKANRRFVREAKVKVASDKHVILARVPLGKAKSIAQSLVQNFDVLLAQLEVVDVRNDMCSPHVLDCSAQSSTLNDFLKQRSSWTAKVGFPVKGSNSSGRPMTPGPADKVCALELADKVRHR